MSSIKISNVVLKTNCKDKSKAPKCQIKLNERGRGNILHKSISYAGNHSNASKICKTETVTYLLFLILGTCFACKNGIPAII